MSFGDESSVLLVYKVFVMKLTALIWMVLAGSLSILLIVQVDDPIWKVASGVGLAVASVCAWGLWTHRRWAPWVSWGLAAGAFGLGCYGAWFLWTFWPFAEPTLKARVTAVLRNPVVMLLLVGPLVWMISSLCLSMKPRFRRQPTIKP